LTAVCDPAAVDVWSHGGKLYEVNSFYSLPDDAWLHELQGLTGPQGTGPCLAVVIPDETPDGPFTPKHAGHVVVAVGDGVTPWPILRRLLNLVESSGDIISNDQLHLAAGDEILVNDVWTYDGKRFEVNSFHLGSDDAWCYELYEVRPDTGRNDYIEVRIPDANPEGGPFIPEPADHVTLAAHGEWEIPWPVFQRFIQVICASGDIIDDQAAQP
jgi:hypothetical protein